MVVARPLVGWLVKATAVPGGSWVSGLAGPLGGWVELGHGGSGVPAGVVVRTGLGGCWLFAGLDWWNLLKDGNKAQGGLLKPTEFLSDFQGFL